MNSIWNAWMNEDILCPLGLYPCSLFLRHPPSPFLLLAHSSTSSSGCIPHHTPDCSDPYFFPKQRSDHSGSTGGPEWGPQGPGGPKWGRPVLITLPVLPHESHNCSGLSLSGDGSVVPLGLRAQPSVGHNGGSSRTTVG